MTACSSTLPRVPSWVYLHLDRSDRAYHLPKELLSAAYRREAGVLFAVVLSPFQGLPFLWMVEA